MQHQHVKVHRSSHPSVILSCVAYVCRCHPARKTPIYANVIEVMWRRAVKPDNEKVQGGIKGALESEQAK